MAKEQKNKRSFGKTKDKAAYTAGQAAATLAIGAFLGGFVRKPPRR